MDKEDIIIAKLADLINAVNIMTREVIEVKTLLKSVIVEVEVEE